jgi:hypothetical protein
VTTSAPGSPYRSRKVVQERLGHAAIAITLDVYSHVTEGLHGDAASRVAGIIFGTTVSTPLAKAGAATLMSSTLTCENVVSEGGLEPPPPCGD